MSYSSSSVVLYYSTDKPFDRHGHQLASGTRNSVTVPPFVLPLMTHGCVSPAAFRWIKRFNELRCFHYSIKLQRTTGPAQITDPSLQMTVYAAMTKLIIYSLLLLNICSKFLQQFSDLALLLLIKAPKWQHINAAPATDVL